MLVCFGIQLKCANDFLQACLQFFAKISQQKSENIFDAFITVACAVFCHSEAAFWTNRIP